MSGAAKMGKSRGKGRVIINGKTINIGRATRRRKSKGYRQAIVTGKTKGHGRATE